MIYIYLQQKDHNEDLFKEGVEAFKQLSNEVFKWEWPDDAIGGWEGYFDRVNAKMISNDFHETPQLLSCLKQYGINAIFYNFSGEYFEEVYCVNGVLKDGVSIDFNGAEYFMDEDEDGKYEDAEQEKIIKGFKSACKKAVSRKYHESINEFFDSEDYENYEVFCDDEFDTYGARDAIHAILHDYILPNIELKSSKYMPEFELDVDRFDVYDEEDW